MHDEEPSEEMEPKTQGVQPTAPLMASYSLYFPARHEEQLVLPPIEYVPAGQATIPVRSVSEMGLKPAGEVLQLLTPIVLEYLPSSLHSVHSVAVPPIDAVPARQSPHSVSAIGVQVLIMYFPAAQVAQVEQPAAPASLVFPLSQLEQVSAPPVEYVPGWHCSSPCNERGESCMLVSH